MQQTMLPPIVDSPNSSCDLTEKIKFEIIEISASDLHTSHFASQRVAEEVGFNSLRNVWKYDFHVFRSSWLENSL